MLLPGVRSCSSVAGTPQPLLRAEGVGQGVCCLLLRFWIPFGMLLMGCVVCGAQPNQYAMSSDRPVVRPAPSLASRVGMCICMCRDCPGIKCALKPLVSKHSGMAACLRGGLMLLAAHVTEGLLQLHALHLLLEIPSQSTDGKHDCLMLHEQQVSS